ncbi:hypothetical protein V8G54_004974 [Vigna mungo]|uniref:Uncharacterized protein n=1 Tax=Vigna mungo TaxID=3915 RepID=A0AAQ3PD90_VIGMU
MLNTQLHTHAHSIGKKARVHKDAQVKQGARYSASSASSEDSSEVDESMEVRKKSQSAGLLEKEKTAQVPSVTLRASQKLAVMCLGNEHIAIARSLCPLAFTNILIIYSGQSSMGVTYMPEQLRDDHDSHCNALLVHEKVEGQGDMLEKMSKVRTGKVLHGEATPIGHVCGINRVHTGTSSSVQGVSETIHSQSSQIGQTQELRVDQGATMMMDMIAQIGNGNVVDTKNHVRIQEKVENSNLQDVEVIHALPLGKV